MLNVISLEHTLQTQESIYIGNNDYPGILNYGQNHKQFDYN